MRIDRIKTEINNSTRKVINTSLKHSELVKGKSIEKFEERIRVLLRKKYCVSTVNGFSALFLAIKTLDLFSSKIVLPAISTCFAIPNAILATNNIPVYCDVDLNTGNLDLKSLKETLKTEKVDAIISPNHFGILSDIENIKKFSIPVIEDCAQSFLSSAQIDSKADIQIFSFYPTKEFSAIDGGAVVTNNDFLGKKLVQKINYRQQDKCDKEARFNFQILAIHAAVGLNSLSNFEQKKKSISKISGIYRERFKKVCRFLGQDTKDILYKFMLYFPNKGMKYCSMDSLNKSGIECAEEFIALTDLKNFPVAKKLIDQTCSIPFRDNLIEDEIEYICKNAKYIIREINYERLS